MAMTLPVLNAMALTESSGEPVVTKYYFHAGKRVAMDRDGVVQWLVGDHLGTTSVVLDDQGGKIAESRHYPYGEERWRWPQEGTFPTEYRFTGQRNDSGLGLYHMGARHYAPYINRFISPDSIIPQPGNPQSFNRYAYCLGNPLRYVDPTGHGETENPWPVDAIGLRIELSIMPLMFGGDANLDILYNLNTGEIDVFLSLGAQVVGEGASVNAGLVLVFGLTENAGYEGEGVCLGGTVVPELGAEADLCIAAEEYQGERPVAVFIGGGGGAEISIYASVGGTFRITDWVFSHIVPLFTGGD